MNHWNTIEAIDLCRRIETVCPLAGCHVALTGGTLYKEGPRKDLDILFYRIRQEKQIKMDILWNLLEALNIKKSSGFGWCYKAKFGDKTSTSSFLRSKEIVHTQ